MSMGTVDIAPGETMLRLPDGSHISLRSNWVDRDHWGTVDLDGPFSSALDPFSYVQSQMVPGSHIGRCATSVDTSLPRGGYSGLPRDHRFIVFGWRAAIIAPAAVIESDAAQFFFATTSVRFDYNYKTRAALPLSELLRVVPAPMPESADVASPRPPQPAGVQDKPILGRTFVLPIDIRESLSFECRIEPQSMIAMNAFFVTVKHVGAPVSLRVFLSGLYTSGDY